MKLLLINSVCKITSTGRIVSDIYDKAKSAGIECKIAYGELRCQNDTNGYETIKIGNILNNYLHALGTRITDKHGLYSKKATQKLLKQISEYEPDIIHIHNLHGYYINYEMLFNYLKEHENIRVFWTLHDCWALTGHCAHYTEEGCERFKSECHDCPLKKSYPASRLLDNSSENYLRKKKAFLGIKNLTILVPSEWLYKQVKESFLKDYPVKVVENGVDLSAFKPLKEDTKEKLGLKNKKMILGVSNVWVPNKGLGFFEELSKLYIEKKQDDLQIVIVGRVDNKDTLNASNITYIPFTSSREELNEIYNAANVYVSFSSEETFGLTVVEAMAAGTYPIVMENTACEDIVNSTLGSVVKRDVTAVYEEIERLLSAGEEKLSKEKIASSASRYSLDKFREETVNLYFEK